MLALLLLGLVASLLATSCAAQRTHTIALPSGLSSASRTVVQGDAVVWVFDADAEHTKHTLSSDSLTRESVVFGGVFTGESMYLYNVTVSAGWHSYRYTGRDGSFAAWLEVLPGPSSPSYGACCG